MADAQPTAAAREPRKLARRPSARERALLDEFPGKELPHLMLRRVIGVGGTATVYEAFHARLGVNVAVKVLSVRGEVAEEARTRMLREAQLYATLYDPRIPRVFDVNVLSDGRAYVVLELRSGTPLARLIGEGRALDTKLALHVAEELLEPLAYLHNAGIIHRDVTPANVLIDRATNPPTVCLIDLGIAKSHSPGDPESVSVTRQGTLLGTPQYMAPERLVDGVADERSDVYAVGVLLYEMLTGEAAFLGGTPAEVVAAVLRDAPTDLHERVPTLSPHLVSLVERAMAREPADRFPSARDMLAALRGDGDLAQRVPQEGVFPSEPDLGRDEAFRAHQRTGKWMVGLSLVLGSVLFGLWSLENHAAEQRSEIGKSVAVERPASAVREAPAVAPAPAAPRPAEPAAPMPAAEPAAAMPSPSGSSVERAFEEPAEPAPTAARDGRRAHHRHARPAFVPLSAPAPVYRTPVPSYDVKPLPAGDPAAPARQTPRSVPENPYERIPENPYQ